MKPHVCLRALGIVIVGFVCMSLAHIYLGHASISAQRTTRDTIRVGEGAQLRASPSPSPSSSPSASPSSSPSSPSSTSPDTKNVHPSLGDDPPSRGPHVRLFCFMVISPVSYELELLKGMLRIRDTTQTKPGFLGCDSYAVYSNVSELNGVPGDVRVISAIQGSMDILHNTIWDKTVRPAVLKDKWARNAPILKAAWDQFFQDVYAKKIDLDKFDYVVKVDADTVFSADKLRFALSECRYSRDEPVLFRSLGPTGYQYYFVGAIEIFTLAAVRSFMQATKDGLSAAPQCKAISQQTVPGNSGFIPSEDTWISTCMGELHVRARTISSLLLNMDCHFPGKVSLTCYPATQ